MEQDDEANPIKEIFDEVFTLMEDLETRSVAALEYLREQAGATDEKLDPIPYPGGRGQRRTMARRSRARMEHLMAPSS